LFRRKRWKGTRLRGEWNGAVRFRGCSNFEIGNWKQKQESVGLGPSNFSALVRRGLAPLTPKPSQNSPFVFAVMANIHLLINIFFIS
jgi:hypothetical protein